MTQPSNYDVFITAMGERLRAYKSGAQTMTTPKSYFEKLIAAVDEKNTAMVRRLVADNADLGKAKKNGWTALMWAAADGRVECVKALIPVSDCEAVDEAGSGGTALIHAARSGYVDCVKALLPFADCHVADNEGVTALMNAAWSGNSECVRLLLPFSDCLAVDVSGMTALMSAAHAGQAACVEALLPSANIRAVDEFGVTASHHARNQGHGSLADLIEAYDLAREERAALSTVFAGRSAPRAKSRSL